jgi:pilus assembly protein CpaB
LSRGARFGILIAIVGIILVVVGILVVGRVLSGITAKPAAAPPTAIPAQVLVTTHAMSLGAVIRAEDVRVAEVPVELAPPGALTEAEQAIGHITKIPMSAGEMVLPHHLADPTNITHDLAFIIGQDQVLMAFPITDLMSQLNILQRGDLVDLLVSIDEPIPTPVAGAGGEAGGGESRLFTFDAMQRVEISAVVVEIIQQAGRSSSGATTAVEGTPQPTPIPAPSQTRPTALMLALNPQDALIVKHLKDAGATFDIVLRSPTANQMFDVSPVMPEYLTDKYQLEIVR